MLAWYLREFQGIRSSIAKIFYIFVIFGTPWPLSRMVLANVYTENPSYCAHRLCVLSIACTNFSIGETFFPEFHSGLIWIQTVFENVNRKRERETGACTSFRECISGSASRERERERERERDACVCVCFFFFWISSFFWLWELAYVFQSFV